MFVMRLLAVVAVVLIVLDLPARALGWAAERLARLLLR